MKLKSVYLIIVLLLNSSLSAQDIQVIANQTYKYEPVGTIEIVLDFIVVNISNSQQIVFEVRTINDVPLGWSSSLCFGDLCFAPFLDSVATTPDFQTPPLEPGDTLDTSIHFYTDQTSLATGHVQLEVGTFQHPQDRITIDFIATTIDSFLVINTPNGGEFWEVNTTQHITWQSGGVENIKIEYTTNYGSNWQQIVASYPANPGIYNWLIPNTPSTQCKVRIGDIQDTLNTDVSDNSFSIILPIPSMILLYPNGGEQFEPGDIMQIQWTSQNVQNIKIDISTNSGLTWDNISISAPASQGQYTWSIPNLISSNECLIKICDVANPSVCDESNSNFTIQANSSVTVLSPNGGEIWQMGSLQEIRWLSDNVVDVKIDLSLNNGVTWTTIVDSTPSTGIYSWEVQASLPSIQCLIKVTDLAITTSFDVSDNIFEIESIQSVSNNFNGIPDHFTLIQNYPNPFNPKTKIYYGVPQESFVDVAVYDILGNLLARLISETHTAGYYSLEFDATNYNSGIYFYQLKADTFIETKKMVLMK